MNDHTETPSYGAPSPARPATRRATALLAALWLLACAEPGSSRLETGDAATLTDTTADAAGPTSDLGQPHDTPSGPDAESTPDAPTPVDAPAPRGPDAAATDALAPDAATPDTNPADAIDATSATDTPEPADASLDTSPDGELPPPFDPLDPGPITCGTMGFGAVTASFHDLSLTDGIAIFQAYDAELPPFGVLSVEIYDRVVTEPTVIDLTAMNYEDCLICVRVRTGCRGIDCPENWLAESGRLTLTSWQGHFTGYLDNVQLRAVDIDPDTFVSTPRDAPGWCLDRFIFSVAWD